MKRIYLLTLSLFAFSFAQAQVTGVKSIPGDYPTLAAALADLNTQGVGSGGATINIAGGYTETAPVGGFILGSATLNASLSASNPLIIQKNGAGANPRLFAPVGSYINTSTTYDFIFGAQGVDYVTIDGIDLEDPITNVTNITAMEYGYYFANLNADDGCNNNTIKNCTVKYNKTALTLQMGIVFNHASLTSTTLFTLTNVSGASSNNNIYSNTIDGAMNIGIYFNGYQDANAPYALYDQNNNIGGLSAADGNRILNLGGIAGGSGYITCYGILTNYQNNTTISYNEVSNQSTGGFVGNVGISVFGLNSTFNIRYNNINLNGQSYSAGPSAHYGIYANAIGINAVIEHNTVSNTIRAAYSGTVANYGIIVLGDNATIKHNNVTTTMGISAANYSIYTDVDVRNEITDNLVKGGTLVSVTSAYAGIICWGTCTDQNIISRNTVGNFNYTHTGAMYLIYNENSSPNTTFENNTLGGITRTGASGAFYGMYNYLVTTNGEIVNRNNTISNVTLNTSGGVYGIYDLAGNNVTTGPNITLTKNIVESISNTSTGALYGIFTNHYAPSSTVDSNIVRSLSTTSGLLHGLNFGGTSVTGIRVNANVRNSQIYGLSSTTGEIVGLYVSSVNNGHIYNNKIYNLNSTGATGIVNGILSYSGTNVNIYNNLIGNLTKPSGNADDLIRGISIPNATAANNQNIRYNTIYLNATSTGTNFGTTGIYQIYNTTATTANLTLQNNLVYNESEPRGTGRTVGIKRSAATNLNNYNIASSNNLIYCGTPGTNRLLYYDGTNAIQNITDLQTLVSPREAGSVSGTIDFLSLAGASNDFLHINSYTPSIARGAATAIADITTDFDNETRHPSTPDIGADEMCKLELDSVRDGSHCGPGTVVLNAFGNALTTEYRWYDEPTGGTLLGTTTTNAWTTPSITGTTTYYVAAANATCEWPTRTAVVATIIPLPLAPVITPDIDTIVCIGSSFNLTSNTVAGHTYGWEANPVVGAGTISGGNNISVTPTLTGNYVYTLTITETVTGCSTSVNTGLVQVTAIPNPTISITSNIPSPLCSGVQVTFTANITDGGPTPDLTWYANSTNIGTGLSINYTPAGGEVVTCSYVSSAPCASTTAIVSNGILMDVTTSVTPSVTISNNAPSPLCAGTSVLFNATPINGGPTPVLTWKSSTNGTIGTGTTLNYTPADGEVITCELQSSFACATSSLVVSNAMTMAVNPILTPTVSISTNTAWPVCAGTSVTFTANTTNGGTLNYVVWKSGTNIINSGSLSFNYVPSDGEIITCELTSNQSCLSSTTAISAPFTTAVTPLPIINITPQGALTLCTGHSLTLTAHSGAGFYNWYKDGVNQGSNTSTYDATSAGTYYADVTINGCTTASNEVIITEVPEPIAVIMAQGPTRICNGQEVELTFVGNGDFVWERDGASLGINTVNYTANVSGIYTVSTTNTSCIITSNTIEVIVEPIPTAIIAYTGSNIVCEGTTVELRAAGSAADDYIWYNNNVMVGTGNTYTATTSGRYQYEAVVATCSTRSNIVNITVNPLPQPVIRQDGYIMYTDTFYNTYQWYREGVAMQGANNYRITAQSNGIYHVVVTDYAGCENRSNEIFINSYVGIDDVNVDAISIYPNPAKDVINIKAPVTVNASLFAMDGKLIKQQHNATQLSVADVAAGIYMLRVYNSNNQLIKVEKVSISNK